VTTRIRPARLSDRDQVWPLARALATSYEVERAAYDATFATLLDSDDALLLVAERDRLVGYLLAQLQHTFHANRPAVWVQEVLVSPDCRGVGVGRSLLAAAEVWAGDAGAAYVAVATRRAAGFYLAVGYRESAAYFKREL